MLARTMESYLYEQEGFSLGMHYAVQCREEVPFTTLDSTAAAAADYVFADEFMRNNQMMFSVCPQWSANGMPNPVEALPVFSDVPVLVMGGEYDPITPPHWALMAAGTLPNSHYYEIPSVGHGVTVSHPCASDIMRQFLDNPMQRPNDSCIAGIAPIEWLVVDNTIVLVPFVASDLGIAGVRPEGWDEINSGVFLRSDMTSEALLGVLVDPTTDPDAFLRNIAQEFQIYVAPDAIDSHAANGLTWQIYEFRSGETIFTVGVSGRAGFTYGVILLSQRFERDDLVEAVLLPALDNFQHTP